MWTISQHDGPDRLGLLSGWVQGGEERLPVGGVHRAGQGQRVERGAATGLCIPYAQPLSTLCIILMHLMHPYASYGIRMERGAEPKR